MATLDIEFRPKGFSTGDTQTRKLTSSIENLENAIGSLNFDTLNKNMQRVGSILGGATKNINNFSAAITNISKGNSGADLNSLKASTEAYRAELIKLKAENQALRNSMVSNRQAISESKLAYENGKVSQQAYRTESARLKAEIDALRLKQVQNRQQIVATNGSYREAQQRLTTLGNAIKNAEGGFSRMTPALRAQVAEYRKLNDQLKSFDKAMGNNQRNVGNYGSALSNIIPQMASFTTSAGLVATAVAGINKSFTTNLKLDSLYEGLKVASGSTESFSKNVSFLRESSDRLGLSFSDTVGAFKNWYASATGANITGEESRRIFEAVANAGAKLRLSTDQVNGALLALSQMASKGKVQAEELRGQLGERLPRAFELASKAMGVSTAELNKMLERGEVMSDVFLPKFANELNKAFGSDSNEKIEGMQASINRLSTAMDTLWESEKVKNWFTEAVDGVAELTEEITKLINSNSGKQFWGRFWDKDYDAKRQTVLQSSGFSSLSSDEQLKRINKQRIVIEGLAKSYGTKDIRFTSQFNVLNQMTKEYASQFSLVQKINDVVEDTNHKRKSSTKSMTSDILGDLTGVGLNYYDSQISKITNDYDKLVTKIKQSSGSGADISKALNLAGAKRDLELLKLSVDRFIDSTKTIKPITGKQTVSISGAISNPTVLPGLSSSQERINRPNISNLGKEDKDLNNRLGRVVERGFRQGFSNVFNTIEELGSNFQEVFSNVFNNLASSLNNVFQDLIATQLGDKFSKMLDSENFKLPGLSKDISKAVVAGVGIAGGLISSMTSKTSYAGQGLGGALTGAAAGTAIAPGIGTLIGGVIGGIAGLFGASSARRQQKIQEEALEEQKKQTRLLERQSALAFMSDIIGQKTNQGIVSGIQRNEFGEIVFEIEGRTLKAVLGREEKAQGRGLY